jgi:arylsulfatase
VGSKNSEVPGGRDYMSPAGAKLPENDLEGKRCIFDSYDMSPLLFGTGKSQRTTWFYFTEKKISA